MVLQLPDRDIRTTSITSIADTINVMLLFFSQSTHVNSFLFLFSAAHFLFIRRAQLDFNTDFVESKPFFGDFSFFLKIVIFALKTTKKCGCPGDRTAALNAVIFIRINITNTRILLVPSFRMGRNAELRCLCNIVCRSETPDHI